jgi:hypothetical protein
MILDAYVLLAGNENFGGKENWNLAGWEGKMPSKGKREGRERGTDQEKLSGEKRERSELLSHVLLSSGQICCCSPIYRPPQLRPSLWPSFWQLLPLVQLLLPLCSSLLCSILHVLLLVPW